MIPTAEVLSVRGNTVTVRCPYCEHPHKHETRDPRGGTERHAPGCGLTRTADQRAAGYRFTTPARDAR